MDSRIAGSEHGREADAEHSAEETWVTWQIDTTAEGQDVERAGEALTESCLSEERRFTGSDEVTSAGAQEGGAVCERSVAQSGHDDLF